MAWSSVGTWASATSTSSSGSLTIFRPGSPATPAGDVLILTVTCDNVDIATGQTDQIVGVTDSRATWYKVAEYTYSAGSAGDGVTCAVFYCPVTSQIATGGSIAVNFASNVTSKAGIVRQMRTSGDASGVTIADGDIKLTSIAGGDAPSLTISNLPSREYLFWRSIGSESNSTGLTVTTNYTAGGAISASTGTASTSVTSLTEFRILTATGDTSNPGHNNWDQVGIYFALQETSDQIDPQTTEWGLAPAKRALPHGYDVSVRSASVPSETFDSFGIISTDLPVKKRMLPRGITWSIMSVPQPGDVVYTFGQFHTELPPKRRALPRGLDLTVAYQPNSSEISIPPQIGWFALPQAGPPPLPKHFAGWMNRENNLACALNHTTLPPQGKYRVDYLGIATHTLFEDSRAMALGRMTELPRGRDRQIDYYLGAQAMPLSAPSVEATQRYTFDVPLARDRNSYGGFVVPPVGDDADEIISQLEQLPQRGRDRARWICDGLQAFDVVDRDQTGETTLFRTQCEHTANPPHGRDKHSYAGLFSVLMPEDVVPPQCGYQWDAPNPRGRNGHIDRYLGAQERIDFEDLRQNPVAGFLSFDLPVTSAAYSVPPDLYSGYWQNPVLEDFIPPSGKIWRPIYRPRRR